MRGGSERNTLGLVQSSLFLSPITTTLCNMLQYVTLLLYVLLYFPLLHDEIMLLVIILVYEWFGV